MTSVNRHLHGLTSQFGSAYRAKALARHRWGGEEPDVEWKKNETWRLAGRAGDLRLGLGSPEVRPHRLSGSQTLAVPDSSLHFDHLALILVYSTRYFFSYKRIRFVGFLFQFLPPEEYATLDPSIVFCPRVGHAGPVGLWLSTPQTRYAKQYSTKQRFGPWRPQEKEPLRTQ
jgi:hypothetical protein